MSPNDEGTNKKNAVSKECIFETIASEAAGLYNLLITVSTGVFGATLLFLDRIAPSPTKESLWFLGIGWLMLILCSCACVWIRWKNLESGRLALEDKFDEASKIDKPNRILTKLAILFLFFGVTFVAIFGFINITHKAYINEGKCKMCDNKEKKEQPQSKKDITEHAIPYGSIKTPQEEQNGNNANTNVESEDYIDPSNNPSDDK